MLRNLLLLSCFIIFSQFIFAQKSYRSFSYAPPDTFDRKRCTAVAGISIATFAATTYWLNTAWYQQYGRSKFHFFNDNGEWMQMDKYGHVFSAYFQSRWASEMYHWVGVKPRKSDWIGVAYGLAAQTSLEIADGFSTKWGFSKGDFAANLIGTGSFIAQQLLWNEQRISLKVSSTPKTYPNTLIYSEDRKYTIPLSTRAYSLLGNNYPISFIKDYNEQTLWVSANVASFLPKESRFPKWLNIALGYSVENAFVGDNSYSWTQAETKNGIPIGTVFTIDKNQFPRYRQVLLSLDIDLTKIKTKNHFLNTMLHIVNVVKIPAPALEFNSLGQFKGHLFYF